MWWLKTAGAVLIIGSSGLFGLMGARRFEKRVSQLKGLRLAINFLEKEITCMHTPLTHALLRTAQFSNSPIDKLFAQTARNLQGKLGLTAREAWSGGVELLRNESDLKPDDLELLKSVAAQIGMSNSDEQKKFLKLIQEELHIQEARAMEEVQAGHKLWTYGGFILGTMTVLLLI